MGSGNRASMREGPLAALFRKTEEERIEPRSEPPVPDRGQADDQAASAREESPREAEARSEPEARPH